MEKTQCASCKKYFSSDNCFDLHLTGDYATPKRKSTRRCKTDSEMAKERFASETMIVGSGNLAVEAPVWFPKKPKGRLRKSPNPKAQPVGTCS